MATITLDFHASPNRKTLDLNQIADELLAAGVDKVLAKYGGTMEYRVARKPTQAAPAASAESDGQAATA
jgi:hypothetical protein